MSFDILAFNKRLTAGWSAWAVTKALSDGSFIDEVRLNYNKFEKKVKIRTLLALIGIDGNKRKELAIPIRRLLNVATEDQADKWIPITAAVVEKSMYGNNLENDQADVEFKKTIDEIVKCSSGDMQPGILYSFLPEEFRFLNAEILGIHLRTDVVWNKESDLHFVFEGSHPNFIDRQQSYLDRKAKKMGSKDTEYAEIMRGGRAADDDIKASLPGSAPPSKRLKPGDNQGEFHQDYLRNVSASSSVSSVRIDPIMATSKEAPVSSQVSEDRGPQLGALFAESPLLSESQKSEIRLFFNREANKISPATSETDNVKKYKLSEAEKVNDAGVPVRESIYLVLHMDSHSWKKIKKKKELVKEERIIR